jgi:hypothetical protein
MPAAPMTDTQYVAHQGNQCPFCRSTNIESRGNAQFDADGATREAGCDDCGKSWLDVYRLVGFDAGRG